jgi:uncharacterized membrane protein YidH (DUF202 family)
MSMLATVVDTHALLRVILYSLIAGAGVTGVFSFAIVGLTRFDEIRHGRRAGRSFPWIALTLAAALVVVAVVIEAIVLMTNK